MSSGLRKSHCVRCDKERATSKCTGCLQDFCYTHFIQHHQELNKQLEDVYSNYSLFRQALNFQISRTNNELLFRQIDQWEYDSIRLVQQTANECRQILSQHPSNDIHQIDMHLVRLTDQIEAMRHEDDFNEMDINQFKEKLEESKERLGHLVEELDRSSVITVQHTSTPLINKILVTVSSQQPLPSININNNSVWKRHGIMIAGGNGRGSKLNQLAYPRGIYVDDDDRTIYLADHDNHRIVRWRFNAMNGEIVAGGNGPGKALNQLDRPTDVIVDKKNDSLIICDRGNSRVVRWFHRSDRSPQIIIPNIYCSRLTIDDNGSLYVSDGERHEVKRWKTGEAEGTVVAGGNGKGDFPNQLNSPTALFVDQDHSVYVSDHHNNRVMKWVDGALKGMLVAGGHGQGDSRANLDHPQGLVVDRFGNIYIADSWNHRIVRWSYNAKKGVIIVGANGRGDNSDQFQYPVGLSFDQDGSLYVVDQNNNRVQKFTID
ncbi:unnamed protein product [Adineta ricciae]|uniref:Uncharacterized protein n=1 Tax=Adineta ricciae TaxID=249248 RepID=A0A815EVW7_ADIRI|nr:unnamed protein product [Adineta ricciae]